MIPTGGIDCLSLFDETDELEEDEALTHAEMAEEVDILLAELTIGSEASPGQHHADEGTKAASALAHFARYLASCACEVGSCISRVKGAEELCKSFSRYSTSTDEPRHVVKAMLLAICSGPAESSDLVAAPERRRQRKRRGAVEVNEPIFPVTTPPSVTTVVYTLRGVRMMRRCMRPQKTNIFDHGQLLRNGKARWKAEAEALQKGLKGRYLGFIKTTIDTIGFSDIPLVVGYWSVPMYWDEHMEGPPPSTMALRHRSPTA